MHPQVLPTPFGVFGHVSILNASIHLLCGTVRSGKEATK